MDFHVKVVCTYTLHIRGMSTQKALVQMEFCDKKIAAFVKEVSRPLVYNEV